MIDFINGNQLFKNADYINTLDIPNNIEVFNI